MYKCQGQCHGIMSVKYDLDLRSSVEGYNLDLISVCQTLVVN